MRFLHFHHAFSEFIENFDNVLPGFPLPREWRQVQLE